MGVGHCPVSRGTFKQIDSGRSLWHRDNHQRDLFHLGVGCDSCLPYQIQENPAGLTRGINIQSAVRAVYQLRCSGAVCGHSGYYAVCGCDAPGFAADAAVVYWIIYFILDEKKQDNKNMMSQIKSLEKDGVLHAVYRLYF